MIIYIVGNESVKPDSLPHRLIKSLKQQFPQHTIVPLDPTESIIPEKESIIIDTVEGLNKPKLFENLDEFLPVKSISVHDYDLYLNLQLLYKTKQLRNIKIIGVPYGEFDKFNYDEKINQILVILRRLTPKNL